MNQMSARKLAALGYLSGCLWTVTVCMPLQAQTKVDPRGPIAYPGMKVTVAPGDVQAPGYEFNPDTAKPDPWKGQWIGIAKNENAPLMLRRVFQLPDNPTRVRAWISADPYARTYINGVLVSRDPDDIGRDFKRPVGGEWTGHWWYEARDLTPYFRAGDNVVAAEVIRDTPMLSIGPSGYLFEASAEMHSGSRVTMASDEQWKAIASPQVVHISIPSGDPKKKAQTVIVVDAAKEPAGWREAGFDDGKWAAAVPASADRGELTASQIPPCMEAIYPIESYPRATDGITVPQAIGGSIKITKDGSFAVRYDHVMGAYVNFRAHGPAGTRITLSASEDGSPGGSRKLGGVSLGKGETLYDSAFIDSFSTVNVDVSHVTGEVTINDWRAVYTSQPVTYRGSFECSDDNLSKLWMSLKWSLQLCLQTHHLDSPNHYEPICDPGDYLVESIANDYAFASPWLARQDLKKYAWLLEQKHYRPFHTSYALMWLQMLTEYYRYTGDADLVKTLAPIVHGLIDEFASYRGDNGLLSNAPDFMFMDWVTVDGFTLHHPPAVIGQGYMTALFYRALEDGILVSDLTGDKDHAAKYKALRPEIAAAYERELWNPDKGLYRDGKPGQSKMTAQTEKKWTTEAVLKRWLPPDKDVETFTPQNNSMAILYGLAPADRAGEIADKLFSGDLSQLNMQPYFWFFAMPAMERAGRFEQYALPLMREMQIHPESQTASEMLHSGDLSHAWISAPLINLSAHVLGVAPLAPAFARIAIHPLPSGLTWAKGIVPTPHGDVSVAWKIDGTILSVDATIPDGTIGDFKAPPGFVMDGTQADLPPGRASLLNAMPRRKADRASYATMVEQVQKTLLKVSGITKSFGGVRALKGVSFELHAGEVHALVGENGAGKSTLIKLMTGAHVPDAGTIELDGRLVGNLDPATARALGIAVVYQQPALFPDLTVTENISLRLEPGGLWRVLSWKARAARTKQLLDRVGAAISPGALVRNLTMPQQQLVEIASAVGGDARVLILDEPTASLTDREVNNLFRVIRELKAAGVGMIYISHRLEELPQIADRVTVLRDGSGIGTRSMVESDGSGVDRAELIRMMVGRELSAVFPKVQVPIGDVVLEAKALCCHFSGVRQINLTVRAGQILGLAGLVGAGRTELARVLFGLTPADEGEILLRGKRVKIDSPAQAISLGIAYVPEDRRRHGVVLEMSIAQNTTLATLRKIASGGIIDLEKERKVAQSFVDRLGTKTPSIDVAVGNLSGGNQQKVALARWLAAEPAVMILDEPTQGVDVGAKSEIHRLMSELAGRGLAIIMISSELPEVLGMSDRVAVMHGGAITGVLDRSEATQERVLEMAMGEPATLLAASGAGGA